jgi:chromosome segregation ATPase
MNATPDESGCQAALALTRLTGLRQDAASAYASITAMEDTLRTLAGQRVTAERSLRAVWHRYGTVRKALEAHARAKPGLRAQLSTWFGAGREWRARQAELQAVLRDRAVPVDAAQRELAQVQAQFAEAVRARAEAAATLRRLTAECAEAQEEIARAHQHLRKETATGTAGPARPRDA